MTGEPVKVAKPALAQNSASTKTESAPLSMRTLPDTPDRVASKCAVAWSAWTQAVVQADMHGMAGGGGRVGRQGGDVVCAVDGVTQIVGDGN